MQRTIKKGYTSTQNRAAKGNFVEGGSSWNAGLKGYRVRTPEERALISQKTKEAMARSDVRKKHSEACSNRVVTEEGRKKQSEAQKRRFVWDKSPMLRAEVVAKAVVTRKTNGYVPSIETREKASVIGKARVEKMGAEERSKRFGYANKGKTVSAENKLKLSKSSAINYSQKKFPSDSEYRGIKMASHQEVMFASWIDNYTNYTWEYLPGPYQLSDGRYYVPDFRIVETNEFIDVKKHRAECCPCNSKKLSLFVAQGNVLRTVFHPFHNSFDGEAIWRGFAREKKFAKEQ